VGIQDEKVHSQYGHLLELPSLPAIPEGANPDFVNPELDPAVHPLSRTHCPPATPLPYWFPSNDNSGPIVSGIPDRILMARGPTNSWGCISGPTWDMDMDFVPPFTTTQADPMDKPSGLQAYQNFCVAHHGNSDRIETRYIDPDTYLDTCTVTNAANPNTTPVLATPDLETRNVISAQLADGTWLCTISSCYRKFKRRQELSRHHRSTHQQLQLYFCRVPGCERGVRGFPRKDKRKDHERMAHDFVFSEFSLRCIDG